MSWWLTPLIVGPGKLRQEDAIHVLADLVLQSELQMSFRMFKGELPHVIKYKCIDCKTSRLWRVERNVHTDSGKLNICAI